MTIIVQTETFLLESNLQTVQGAVLRLQADTQLKEPTKRTKGRPSSLSQ